MKSRATANSSQRSAMGFGGVRVFKEPRRASNKSGSFVHSQVPDGVRCRPKCASASGASRSPFPS